ncbi:CheR family methyltransferase [Hydrogenimonas sp.]
MFSWLKKGGKTQKSIHATEANPAPVFKREAAGKILEEIKREFGLDYERQEAVTLRKIERFALKNGIYSFDALSDAIEKSDSLKTALINMLTVGETYFYRELEQIELLGEEILSNRCERILSAPCSTGEEVYSILLYLKNRSAIPPSLHITGIDINTDALAKAEKGCYSQRSVSQLPPEITEKWFTQKDEGYCIDAGLKSYTSFAYANIFDPEFHSLGKFDAVLSRNMMIYFTDEEKKKALNQLSAVMHAGSLLFLGHADLSFVPEGFEKIRRGGTVYFKKG